MSQYTLSESDRRKIAKLVEDSRQSNGAVSKPYRRNPRAGGGNSICRAKVVSVGSATLTAYKYNGGTLDESAEITVYCHIAGGGEDLSEAIPHLEADDEILITKLPYLNGEIVEQRWYCTTIFQPMDICA